MSQIALVTLVTAKSVGALQLHLESVALQCSDQVAWTVALCNLAPDAEEHVRQRVKTFVDASGGHPPIDVAIGKWRSWSGLLESLDTEFVWPLQADLLLAPGSLGRVKLEIALHRGAKLLHGDHAWADGAGVITNPSFWAEATWRPMVSARIRSGSPICFLELALQAARRFEIHTAWSEVAEAAIDLGANFHAIPSILTLSLDPPHPQEGEPSVVDTVRIARFVTCVSVVIPSAGVVTRPGPRGEPLIVKALTSLADHASGLLPVEFIVVCDEGFPDSVKTSIMAAVNGNVRFIDHIRQQGDFNFSQMVNQGAFSATGDLLVFVNDDVVMLSEDWDVQLSTAATQTDVGAVGGRLLFEDGSMQHFGLTTQWMHGGLPILAGYGLQREQWTALTPFGRPRAVLAVAGALLAVERRKFLEVGGFSGEFPSDHNDVDLCLKLRVLGYHTVVVPEVTACHLEFSTRPRFREREAEGALQLRWGCYTLTDPYRNPNVTHESLTAQPDWQRWERGQPFISAAGDTVHPSWLGTSSATMEVLEVWPSDRSRQAAQPRIDRRLPGGHLNG